MKKIVFYRYNSICEPMVIRALKQLGYTVTEITKEMTDKMVTPAMCMKLVSESLAGGNVDGVFSINFYPVISEVCKI